jgi:hypothetical protein
MAMSDELLGTAELKPVPRLPEPPSAKPQASLSATPARDEPPRSVRTFFSSWAAWA